MLTSAFVACASCVLLCVGWFVSAALHVLCCGGVMHSLNASFPALRDFFFVRRQCSSSKPTRALVFAALGGIPRHPPQLQIHCTLYGCVCVCVCVCGLLCLCLLLSVCLSRFPSVSVCLAFPPCLPSGELSMPISHACCGACAVLSVTTPLVRLPVPPTCSPASTPWRELYIFGGCAALLPCF